MSQNVIGILQTVIAWAIPDVSSKLLRRIKRENFLLREHIIEYEKRLAKKDVVKIIAEKAAHAASSIIKGANSYTALNNGAGAPVFSDPIEEEEDEMVQLRKRPSNSMQDDSTQL